VIDCGVDLERFSPGDAVAARAELDWRPDGTAFLCVGTLDDRKNVVGLAEAFRRHAECSLAFVGDGPLRHVLAARSDLRLAGVVPHAAIPRWLTAADVVCQPSLVEPFGLATLEAMSCARSVVATRVGGPPEFVAPGAGVLVDPHDVDAIAEGLAAAAALPRPNDAARAAAETHDVRRQVERIEALLESAAGAPAAGAPAGSG